MKHACTHCDCQDRNGLPGSCLSADEHVRIRKDVPLEHIRNDRRACHQIVRDIKACVMDHLKGRERIAGSRAIRENVAHHLFCDRAVKINKRKRRSKSLLFLE